MGRVSLCGTGPASSTGSPTTLMMRPSVPSPTGTAIGWPVSVTSWPRTRPSLMSIATVRTVDSPRCWATSSTSRLPWFLVSSALRIAGRWPSNCTSTTAPMTWVMRPTTLVGVAMNSPRSSLTTSVAASGSQRLGAGNDLDQFLGDHSLAGAVVAQRLGACHVAGVARGAVHRGHARALLGRGIFQERAEHLHGDVARQQLGQDVELVRRVFIGRLRTILLFVRKGRRNDLLRRRNLRHHRLELREEQYADVERAVLEQVDDPVGEFLRVLERQRTHAQFDHVDDLLFVLALELLEPLAADAQELDLLALVGERRGALAGEPHDCRVECTAQAALGRAHHQQTD